MSMSKNIGRSLNASKTINFVERVDSVSEECEEKQAIFTVMETRLTSWIAGIRGRGLTVIMNQELE